MVLLKLLTATLLTLTLVVNPVAARLERRQLDVVWAEKREPVAIPAPIPVVVEERDIKLPPQARASLPSATRKRAASKARHVVTDPSHVPISGNIKVTRADNGDFLGYIKKNFEDNSNNRRFGLTNGQGSALDITGTSSPSGPIELTIQNGQDDNNNPFLGLVVPKTQSSTSLGSGNANVLYLTGSHHTAVNSPPADVDNSYSNSKSAETTIWTYNTVTHQLTAQWVNSGGSKPTTVLYWVDDGGLGSIFVGGENTTVRNAVRVIYTVV